MDGSSVTTSAIISYSQELEDHSSAFYAVMADRWSDHKEAFQRFADEGMKNKLQIVRTYQETISDVLEASYSFEGMNLADFRVEATLPEETSYVEALERAITLEEQACAFYQEVAERSQLLLATIPRAFKGVTKKRGKRRVKLEALLEQARSGV